jgi:thiamine-phosphate pyrophosphorylase
VFELIVLSPQQSVEGEIGLISRMFEQGLNIFHLRKPYKEEIQLEEYICRIPPEFHSRVVIHAHFGLAGKYNLKGIHLNESKRKKLSRPSGKPPAYEKGKILSSSFHSMEELSNNDYPFDYVFLSPVFDSISKPGYMSRFDLKILEEQLKNRKGTKSPGPRIIALGGLTNTSISIVRQMGFSGAGVLGAIWESKDPLAEFLRLKLC